MLHLSAELQTADVLDHMFSEGTREAKDRAKMAKSLLASSDGAGYVCVRYMYLGSIYIYIYTELLAQRIYVKGTFLMSTT